MKIYAKQINPEFQESLLFEDGLFPENMVVCGNRDFKERKTAVFTLVELKQTIFFAGFFLSWTGKNGAGKLSGVAVRVIGTRFFIPWMIGTGKRWPLLK